MMVNVKPWALGLFIIGNVFIAVGLGMAVHSLQQAWREHGNGSRVFERQYRKAGAMARRATGRRPRSHTIRPIGIADTGGIGDGMRVTLTPGPLPDIQIDPTAFAAEVQRQLRMARDATEQTYAYQERELQLRDEETRKLRENLENRLNELERTTKDLAVGDIQERFAGWWLALAGFFLTAISGILQFFM